jgi:hypothetical protein
MSAEMKEKIVNKLRRENRRASRGSRPVRAAVVVGLLAAVAGVTGGAQAAVLVTGKQIKDGTVTGRDVRDGSVTANDVADFSLTPADYAGEVAGPPGSLGERGARGQLGFSWVNFAVSRLTELDPGQAALSIAVCDEGLVAVGGGPAHQQGNRVHVLDSAPLSPQPGERRAWVSRVHNPSNAKVILNTWAVCAEVR